VTALITNPPPRRVVVQPLGASVTLNATDSGWAAATSRSNSMLDPGCTATLG
jgi:hypothetical protein